LSAPFSKRVMASSFMGLGCSSLNKGNQNVKPDSHIFKGFNYQLKFLKIYDDEFN